jgi:hypothetical protein
VPVPVPVPEDDGELFDMRRLVFDGVPRCLESNWAIAGGQLVFASLGQLDEHRHEADEHFLARFVAGFIEQVEPEADVD